jgi:3'-phosphoadenosine 5'-phosphosulfate sulfotransferase (PAPS reductase)/FAD synthetase
MIHVVSVSGGKDSAACCLHLRELGIEHDRVFFDTGWEHADTYAHLDYLETVLGPIRRMRAEIDLPPDLEEVAQGFEARLGHYSAMVRLVLSKAMFPSRLKRYCTTELKVFVAREAFASYDDEVTNVVGIRAAESSARSKLPEREHDDTLDVDVWRPLIAWSEQDVIEIHQRHGVLPNPLYLRGAARVGCWPCIFARKNEIRLIAHEDPDRIAIIADLEAVLSARAQSRDAIRVAAGEASKPSVRAWFQSHARVEGVYPMVPIASAVEWARTKHGGRQPELFAAPHGERGCMRWGLCETDTPGGGTP